MGEMINHVEQKGYRLRPLQSFGSCLPSVWDLISPKLGSRLLKKALIYPGLLVK